MNNERKTGQHTTEQGHPAYYRIIEGNLPEIGEEVPMQEGKWYEPIREVVRAVREKIQEVIR
jgi:hypothetical protein